METVPVVANKRRVEMTRTEQEKKECEMSPLMRPRGLLPVLGDAPPAPPGGILPDSP